MTYRVSLMVRDDSAFAGCKTTQEVRKMLQESAPENVIIELVELIKED